MPSESVMVHPEVMVTSSFPEPPQPAPRPPARPGAGTELKKLLEQLGFYTTTECKCTQRAAEMDQKGPQWCRDNRAKLVEWLKEEAANRSWWDILKGAAQALAPGVFRPSIGDPYGSLVDEAIRRAETDPAAEPGLPG